MRRTDTHYHLDQVPDPLGLLHRCERDQLALITPSMNPASYRELLALQAKSSTILQVACGLHPESIHADEEIEEALNLARTAQAVGEVGLPCYERKVTKRDVQVFTKFCRVAADENKALIVHSVHDQAEPALEVMLDCGVRKAVFHWLKASARVASRIVACGYMVSVTPEVTYRKRDQDLLRLIPKSQLLLETDGPWEHQGPYQGKASIPHWIDDAAHYAAAVYGCSLSSWWEQHEQNVDRLFF